MIMNTKYLICNIYGEGESFGFEDFAVNPKDAGWGNGVTRPLTYTLPNKSMLHIVINNSHLRSAELLD